MRILRISLRNIASLEGTQTVDFTRDPLRVAGLFAISGITGSGKSTLLDALCLALYERTPRLSAARGTVKLADGSDSISQKDPANLLRRGTGEGFAEVAFVGVDQQTYTARWTVRRARNRPEGSLQNTEMTLFRGDLPPGVNGVIEQGGKKTEVLPAIAGKIGLSFEQFTRAVLLAQNDFATFLKAEDKERAEILQALTGTERFEAISVAVFDRASREQRRVADLEARLVGNAPLTPEAREEAESGFTGAEVAWKEANAKRMALEEQAAWFRRLTDLAQQTQSAGASLREKIASRDAAAPRRTELNQTEEASRDARPLRDAERRLRSENAAAEKTREAAVKAEAAARGDLEEKKLRHAAAQATLVTAKAALDDARPHLLQARELDAKLTPLADRLAATTRDREAAGEILKQITATRDALGAKRAAAESERAPLIAKRDALAAWAAFAPEAAAWLQRLDHAGACRKSFDKAAAKLARSVKEEQIRTEAGAIERVKEPGVREASRAALAAFQQAETAAREHDGEKTARARSAADAARTALRDLEKHLGELDALSSQAQALEAEIANLQAAFIADGQSLTVLHEKQIPAAGRDSEAARRAFDLAEAAVTDEAVRLREKLASGQPCPVCGATDHPHAAQPPVGEAAVLRALDADCLAKETALRALREKAAGLVAARLTRLAQEVERQKVLAALQTRLATARLLQHDHPVAVMILALPDDERSAGLTAQLGIQQEILSAAEAAEGARRAAEKTRDEHRIERDRTAVLLAALEKKLAQISEELTGLRVGREGAASAHGEAEKVFQASLHDLAPLFASQVGNCGLWDRDGVAYRNKFDEQAAAFMVLERRSTKLTADIREADVALLPVNEALARAQSEEIAKRSVETTARSVWETIRQQRAGILGGQSADAVEAALAETLRCAVETRDLRGAELEKAGTQVASTAESFKSADLALMDLIDRQTRAIAALDSWLGDFAVRIGRTFVRVDLESVLARDDAWIKAERAALDEMEGAVRAAEGAFAVHQKTLDAHTSSRPTPSDELTITTALAELRPILGEVEQQRNSARAFLMADDQRIRDNAVLADQLRELQAIAEPWLKLNELIGSADGAKFRSIAQRRTLDILLGYANAQLDQLAARYRLERLQESLNLIVVDRDMGDERRSVHSLSGGESFLISLALALALASLTSNRLRIESLFIDEGFGNLDAETLNTAMNALMRLEAQGRKVGVISHVTEMTDAIPVQIRVIKGRYGASRLVVPGGTATTDIFGASGAVLVPGSPGAQNDGATEEIAQRLLDILRREQAAGRTRVSARALREEIGCGLSEFSAARDRLLGQVRTDGRSLTLTPA